MRLPNPKTIYVDCDNTLERWGELNQSLVDYLQEMKDDGYSIYLWSMAGEAHAKRIADHFKVTGLFTSILSKPGIIVDDMGTLWNRSITVLNENMERMETEQWKDAYK